MLLQRAPQAACGSCRRQLYSIFLNGFVRTAKLHAGPLARERRLLANRTFHTTGRRNTLRAEPASATENGAIDKSPAELETIVRQVRDTFGETLPANFLSPAEYTLYERLYGPPLRETLPEDIKLLQPMGDDVVEDSRCTLLKEDQNGDVEEVEYVSRAREEESDGENEGMISEDLIDDRLVEDEDIGTSKLAQKEFKARMMLYQDMAAAIVPSTSEATQDFSEEEVVASEPDGIENPSEDTFDYEAVQEVKELEEEDEDETRRTHAYTMEGRFGTMPSTIQLPKETFVDPITSVLSNTGKKNLSTVALKIFGGHWLPNSTATPGQLRHLEQHPISLQANQSKMTEMEASSYLAAIMPGAYAATMSALVETRKRLGSEWLEGLLRKPGGARILDAGAGGAAIMAMHEIMRAEWERMHPDGIPENEPIPYPKATVITGSQELRYRVSQVLQNTTFLPRIPDFLPERDLPLTQPAGSMPRKQYDVIIAPHTLWTLKEDYIRKAQVQNWWTLLNPNGGVLVVIEKGVPRGFELVAGARDVLLKHHIIDPNKPFGSHIEQQELSGSKFSQPEAGMIVAPCTNHKQCPMYKIPGRSKGRKDYCHFSQRFIRPPYLQRILGAREINHEDIRFSYVAAQRGTKSEVLSTLQQDEESTKRAHAGHDESESVDGSLRLEKPFGNYQNLPRAILPPLKRQGHVTLDLCTPAGTLERWTVPKSFGKQAYRDARKASWGDLWALGAKTRVLRDAKSGSRRDDDMKKKKKKERNPIDTVGTVDNTAENNELREMLRGAKKEMRWSAKQNKVERKKAVKATRAAGARPMGDALM
jgi:ribosomal protein RSM22 (predicted rRNA methylase)